MTIWMFSLALVDSQEIQMPAGAKILDAKILSGDSQDMMAMLSSVYEDRPISLWAIVDPSAEHEARRFAIFGTGHPLHEPDGCRLVHVSTMPMKGSSLIWHLFEVVS